MRLTSSLLLASALTVYDVAAQSITASASASASTPVCGQTYSGTSGNSYKISCGQTYTGNVVQPSNSKLRRTEWSLERRALNEIRAAQSSFEDCIASCEDTSSCIAASFLSGQCILLSDVTNINQAAGAQAAIKAPQASSVLPSLGSSIASEVMASLTKTLLPPNATTTSVSYQDLIAQHVALRASQNAPTITGEDTKVYITAEATSAPSTAASDLEPTSASITTPAVVEKRAASTCSASSVQSNIAVIKKNKPQPELFCENWNAAKPHSSSPWSAISSASGVSTACDCILASFAASSTCASAAVKANVVLIKAAKPTPTGFCRKWIKSLPQTKSPISAIKLASGVTTACKCILANYAVSASTTTSAINTATTGAYVSNTGKRGLCYNDPALTQFFSRGGQNSRVSWGYNWYFSEPSSSFNPALEFDPLLFNNGDYVTSQWLSAAQTAINNGAKALMSFNEPDLCVDGSSCMTAATAASTYKKYMQPFAGKALLGAPAVTNGDSPYGLTWLKSFMAQCTGCQIDFINLHWYSNKYAGAKYFESYINSARAVANGKPIWITEFGLDNSYSYTDAELQSFLQTVMPWMDQQDDIHRYAYFMTKAGILINSDGTGLSGSGAVYNSFVNNTKQPDLF